MEEDNKKDKKSYEISYLIKDEASAKEVSRVLRQHEAEILEEVSPKSIALTYKIKKEPAALFGYTIFKAGPENIPELDKNLKTNPSILRFLIVTPPFSKQETSSSLRRSRPIPERTGESKPTLPLSNEALEKKIEEILQ